MPRPKVIVTANHRRSMISRYTVKGQSLEFIARVLGYSTSVVRRTLAENDVEIAGRGRPTYAVTA